MLLSRGHKESDTTERLDNRTSSLKPGGQAAPLLPHPQPRCTGLPCPRLLLASEGAVALRQGWEGPSCPLPCCPCLPWGRHPAWGLAPTPRPPSSSQALPPNLVHISAPLGLSDGSSSGVTSSPGPCDVQVARSPSCSDGCPSHLHELTSP